MIHPAVIVLALAENILSVDGSFLVILILIICLVFILNNTLFKPINKVLEERERLSYGRSSEAEGILARYEERRNGYESQLRAARAEGWQALETQRKQALAAQQEVISQARTETLQQINTAKADLSTQVESARTKLEQEAQAMATAISSSILQRPTNQ